MVYSHFCPDFFSSTTSCGLHPLFLNDSAWDNFCSSLPQDCSIRHVQFYTVEPQRDSYTDAVVLRMEEHRHKSFSMILARANAQTDTIDLLQSFDMGFHIFSVRVIFVDPSLENRYLVTGQYTTTPVEDMPLVTLYPTYTNKSEEKWNCIPAEWRPHVLTLSFAQQRQVYILLRLENNTCLVVARTEITGDQSCTPWTSVFCTDRIHLSYGIGLEVSPSGDLILCDMISDFNNARAILVRSPYKKWQRLPNLFYYGIFDSHGNIIYMEKRMFFIENHTTSFPLVYSVASVPRIYP